MSALLLCFAVAEVVVVPEVSLKLVFGVVFLLAAAGTATSVDVIEFGESEIRRSRRFLGFPLCDSVHVSPPVTWTYSRNWLYRGSRVLEFEGVGDSLKLFVFGAKRSDFVELLNAVRAASAEEVDPSRIAESN